MMILNSIAFGIVHQLYSSLKITNRGHGCTDEQLILTCNATGRVINWNVGSVHLRFDSINDVDTIMRREGCITAFLLKIIDSSGGVLEKNFLSIIFINVTEAADKRILPNNITCSTHKHSDTFFGSIAGENLYHQILSIYNNYNNIRVYMYIHLKDILL